MMQKTFLLEVLDAMQDMVRVLTPERRVMLSNSRYRACFGDQLGARCYEMFCAGGECAHCVSKIAQDTHKSVDKRKRHHGRVYWINASPIYSETGELEGVVEVMRDVTEMDAEQKRLRAQNRRLIEEMNSAARLQRELFVAELPEQTGIELCSRYLPASHVGGDFFGCLYTGGKAAFYMADVSGHGMSSAMIGLLISDAIRKEVEQGTENPAAILSSAQREFCRITQEPQIYATAFVGMLDPATGLCSWASAGHHAAPVYCQGEDTSLLEYPSLPICSWLDTIEYEEHEFLWEHGGQLLVYTDGLVDPKSSWLNEKALVGEIQSQKGEKLLETLERNVRPDREDDVCMLLISRK